jgi:hypothetical protein
LVEILSCAQSSQSILASLARRLRRLIVDGAPRRRNSGKRLNVGCLLHAAQAYAKLIDL